jgi:hypothetical protein
MAKILLGLSILAAGALGGAAAEWSRTADATPAAADGRYQITAYGYALPNGELRQGVFILDAETGDIHQLATGGGMQKVGRVPGR